MSSNIKTRSRKSELSQKYIKSFIAIVLIVIIVLSFLVFAFYSNYQIDAVSDYSLEQLNQVSTMTDLLYNNLQNISNETITNNYTHSCLNDSTVNRLTEMHACLKLKELQTAALQVRYISLYNSITHRFISSSTVNYFSEEEANFYYNQLQDSDNIWIMRKIGSNYATQKDTTITVFTFIQKISMHAGEKPCLVIIDVNKEYFQSSLSGLHMENEYQEIHLINRNNVLFAVLFSDNDQDKFTETSDVRFGVSDSAAQSDDSSALPETTELTESAGKGSSGFSVINDKNNGQTFQVYSSGQSSGITIVNYFPYSTILRELPQVGLITGLCALAVLTIGIILARSMSKSLYAPIDTLYRKYVSTGAGNEHRTVNEIDDLNKAFADVYAKADKLEQGMIKTYSDSRKRCIHQLIHANFQNSAVFSEKCRQFGIDITSPYYSVIFFSGHLMDGNSIQSNDDYIYDYALENIVTDVLSAISEKVFLYLNSNNILAAVIPLEAEKLPDGIEDLLVPVHETMKNEFGMEITICIGNIVEGYESINLCYESALISSLNSSINHTGKTFHSDEVSNSSEGVQYKVNFKTSLEDYIMRSDTEGIMKEFDVALTMLDNSTIQTVKTYFTHTLMLILDDYSSTFVGKDNTSYQNLIDRIGKINECTNIDIESLKLKYQDFFNMLIQHLASSKKKSSAESIESAKQYIENNYMNPDLSIALLSEKLGITPAYFGKLFSDTTLSSFNDYLTSVRMKKAAVILTTTSISVNKISEMVGIENTNYFYSLFKREFGMTPLSFRQKNSLSE